jgi:hypothetical protein
MAQASFRARSAQNIRKVQFKGSGNFKKSNYRGSGAPVLQVTNARVTNAGFNRKRFQ